MLDFVKGDTWPQTLLELKGGSWGLNVSLIKAKEEYCSHMVVVSRRVLKQDEQWKLFLGGLEPLPQRMMHGIKETIHLSLAEMGN